jgi:hypothetical protein
MHRLVSDLDERLLIENLGENVSQLILCVYMNTSDEPRLPKYLDPGLPEIDVAHTGSAVRAC